MVIEALESLYRAQAEADNTKKRNPFRASSAGRCERELGYAKLGIKGHPLQPRRLAVMKHGTIIHTALTRDLGLALGDRFVPEKKLAARKKLYTTIEGVKISYHPDGAVQLDDGRLGIVEFKTMADFSFERATKGEIDHDYLCQAYVYHVGTDFPVVIFLAYRKETAHVVEIVFDRDANETTVVQRLGGDPLALATNDPLSVTAIRTPFHDEVAEEVRGKFKRLAQVKKEADLAEGVRIIENEQLKVQGKEKAIEYQRNYGEPVKIGGGGWHTFETGRKIAGFPCNYCSMISTCLGARLEINGGKPTWVL